MQAEEQTIQAGVTVEPLATRHLLRLTISRKFLIVFAALAVVGVSNWLVIDSTLSQLRGATTLVNVIGSVRWTSQRIQLDTLRVAQGKAGSESIEQGLERLDAVIDALSGGGSVNGFDINEPPPALRPSIEPMRHILEGYRTQVYAVLDDIRAGGDPDRGMDALFGRGNDMLAHADALAAALSRQISEIETAASVGLYFLALLDLAILATALLAIRVQIVQPLQKLMLASQRFARGDYATRTQLDAADEIGDLARTFDRMAGDIQRDMGKIAGNVLELEKSQALLCKVLDTLPVGVWVADSDGRIIMENPAGQLIWAGSWQSGANIAGKYKGWWADSGEKIKPGEWALTRALRGGATSVGEVINIQSFDGSLKTIMNSAAPLVGPQGEIEGAIVVNEDITERARAAEELRVAKELFQTTFDSAAVGITLYDRTGRFLLCNSALCETLGYSAEELLFKNLHELIHPDDLARDEELERQVIEGKLKRYEVEKRLFRRDGKVVWVVLSIALVLDGEGSPLYFIGQILDITSRKAMEHELIESRCRLRELAAHHDAVREEERKRIALEIHDELGQLLTALKMEIALLRMQFESDSEVGKRAADMRELVEKTICVVRQVATNLRPAALNLGIVPALEWLVDDFGKRTNIAFDLNLASGEFYLDDTKATAIFRIVQESMTNVMRHAQASSVAVSLKHEEGALLLEIQDNGRGFDKESAQLGASFGLLGIRERVLVLGGSLAIDTEKGRGTTLTIRIPNSTGKQT